MTKSEQAVLKHKQGYNCAQAVACSFADELGIDEASLYKLVEGFGAGMGTGKGVCGALSGAAVVAGFRNSNGDINNAGTTKGSTYKLVGNLQNQFCEKVGCIYCKDIKSGANSDHITPCAECIAIATELVEGAFSGKS